ncbi:TRAP transporter small permease [Ammoniphilus resinae]|uniref:TRAP-type C4-dicarboxylate transport system permease small subunit n=1 Tax=Ammoniphilus resinae TaxID=861532 RepID=A0ABS4GPD0_9BACL|nr:TRAP transporter small permease [Ammoniphilus resinae]MBP1932132.1 TRAP-type C4-dicarboxylate transport system permease small subunit [Ammoniphilus resinae]
MIDSMIQRLKSASITLSVAALFLMVLMVMVEITARTFFQFSFLVVDEMAGYLMVAMVFLGLIYSFDSESFVRVEAFYSKYTGKFKSTIDLIFLIIVFIYSSTLTYYIVKLNISSYQLESKSFSYIQTLLYIPQLSMSIGLIGFCLYLVLVILKKVGGKA